MQQLRARAGDDESAAVPQQQQQHTPSLQADATPAPVEQAEADDDKTKKKKVGALRVGTQRSAVSARSYAVMQVRKAGKKGDKLTLLQGDDDE